jgi:hypothetical protein
MAGWQEGSAALCSTKCKSSRILTAYSTGLELWYCLPSVYRSVEMEAGIE